MLRLLTAVTALLLFPRPCPAPVHVMLDIFSDPKLTGAAWKDPRGVALRARMDELTDRILRLSAEDRAALLGPNVGQLPPKRYSLPAGGYRGVMLSGVHVTGEPWRPETYHLLGDAGAIELHYGFSDSPQAAVVYLRDGGRFRSVERRRVGPVAPGVLVDRRLEWDRARLDEVMRTFDARWRARFPGGQTAVSAAPALDPPFPWVPLVLLWVPGVAVVALAVWRVRRADATVTSPAWIAPRR